MKLSAHPDLPPNIVQSLNAYLRSLPGYKPDQPEGRQSIVVEEQHGYLQMQFTHVLEKMDNDTVMGLQRQAGKLTRYLDIQLHDQALVSNELALIQSNIQSWVDRNPDGLIVFDVPPQGSSLWPWVVNRLSHWLDRGLSVWVGVIGEGDIPDSVFRALQPPIHHTIKLRDRKLASDIS